MYTEESGHGYVPSRSGDKMLEDEGCRLSFSRGDGKYGRSSREIRLERPFLGNWHWVSKYTRGFVNDRISCNIGFKLVLICEFLACKFIL